MSYIQIRELPPLGLSMNVAMPSGQKTRWALDEPSPENAVVINSFSTTMPGGFDQCDCTLTRRADFDYADLAEFSTVTVWGLNGAKEAWQGRIEATPRSSGEQLSINPAMVGWSKHLYDNKSAREIYIDIDMTHWQPMSNARITALGTAWTPRNGEVIKGGTGSVVATKTSGAWPTQMTCEMWYDAKGIPIRLIWYYWNLLSWINYTDPNWAWYAAIADNDTATAPYFDSTASMRGAGPGSGSIVSTTTPSTRKYGLVQLVYGVAGGLDYNYELDWTNLSVIGDHGIGFAGTWGSTPGTAGPTPSQVVQHVVNKYAPKLALSRAGISTIASSSFLIPHCVYMDATTAGDIVTDVNKYINYDWWVDEGPTFNYAARGSYGKTWKARVGASNLKEAGPQVGNIANKVIIAYNYVDGSTRTVGPTGSNANTIDDRLSDSDPTNPANVADISIYPPTIPNIGISTPAAAIGAGQQFLSDLKAMSLAGQSEHIGYIEDEHGTMWPTWMMRSGDHVIYVDAHDPIPRRIVKTQYDPQTAKNSVDLDSPAQNLDALIARYGAAIAGTGF